MKLFLTCLILSACAVCISAQGGIRSTDFKNFTYKAYCAGETPEDVTVKDGEFSREKQEDGYVDRFYFSVLGIAYGDLNNDKREEAVILTVCNTGGTGNFSEGFIYGMKSGKPVLLARIPGGDRAYGGLREARVENGLLIVDSNDVGEMGGACCPEFVVTTKYRVTGGKLVKTGTPTRRELVPTKRVTFARGTSGTTFKVTIPGGESVRYIVGARSGQSLSVSVDFDKVSLRLVDDIEVTEGINSFMAKLPRNGDFTIEITNDSDSTREITVNIKIN